MRNPLVRRPTHYSVMGVPPASTQEELRLKWKELAEQYHPDKEHGNEEAFKQLTAAYTVLKDSERRRQYDRQLFLLGDQCTVCNGAGRVRKSKSFTAVAVRICTACEGTGQQLITKENLRQRIM